MGMLQLKLVQKIWKLFSLWKFADHKRLTKNISIVSVVSACLLIAIVDFLLIYVEILSYLLLTYIAIVLTYRVSEFCTVYKKQDLQVQNICFQRIRLHCYAHIFMNVRSNPVFNFIIYCHEITLVKEGCYLYPNIMK